MSEAFFTEEEPHFNYGEIIGFKEQNFRKFLYHKSLPIMISIVPRLFRESDYLDYLNKSSKKAKKMRLLYDENQTNEFTGIINEGNTCYMNSLLQTLYSLNYFRQAIYQLDVGKSEIILSLQRIFYNLQTSSEPVKTTELLQAFGWSKEQRNVQQDAGEFWLMLSDHLED